jgi:hypothetical protein
MNYIKANELLDGRCKLSRKLANNTYLVRHSGVPGDSIHLKLHDTYIITWYADGRTELNTGGWRTVTTKARINEYLADGFGISQVRGQWYLTRYQNGQHTDLCLFEDGLIIAADETISGGTPIEEKTKLLALRRKVNQFADGFARAFAAGDVSAPSAGDCFYCGMREVKTHKPLGEVTGDKDHLLSHLEENYYVPSILCRAMETIPVSIAFKDTVAATWQGQPEHAYFKPTDEWFLKQLKQAVSRYMLRQLGQAA